LFDEDRSGEVDTQEMANCLALMCGGTINDKINAAFILFDDDGSGTLSFNEMSNLVKVVFKVILELIKLTDADKSGMPGVFKGLDLEELVT